MSQVSVPKKDVVKDAALPSIHTEQQALDTAQTALQLLQALKEYVAAQNKCVPIGLQMALDLTYDAGCQMIQQVQRMELFDKMYDWQCKLKEHAHLMDSASAKGEEQWDSNTDYEERLMKIKIQMTNESSQNAQAQEIVKQLKHQTVQVLHGWLDEPGINWDAMVSMPLDLLNPHQGTLGAWLGQDNFAQYEAYVLRRMPELLSGLGERKMQRKPGL